MDVWDKFLCLVIWLALALDVVCSIYVMQENGKLKQENRELREENDCLRSKAQGEVFDEFVKKEMEEIDEEKAE